MGIRGMGLECIVEGVENTTVFEGEVTLTTQLDLFSPGNVIVGEKLLRRHKPYLKAANGIIVNELKQDFTFPELREKPSITGKYDVYNTISTGDYVKVKKGRIYVER